MLNIALICDSLTEMCIASQANYMNVTPDNYKKIFKERKFDFLFVESAWQGAEESWKYKIAKYKKTVLYPTTFFRNNNALTRVVEEARNCGVPTVFWNKEDDVHFDRFVKSALLFDHILTVDTNSVSKYKKRKPEGSVSVLPFPVQEQFHFFSGFHFTKKRANFAGSYSTHVHDERRMWQNTILQTTPHFLPLDVYDRNSNRKSSVYRYPDGNYEVFPCLKHSQTSRLYKDYFVSFNVNTVVNSESMYSRRLVEILACGGMAISNPSKSINKHFLDYCFTFKDEQELKDLLYRVSNFGHSVDDLEKMRAGAEFVAKNFTWKRSLNRIFDLISKKATET